MLIQRSREEVLAMIGDVVVASDGTVVQGVRAVLAGAKLSEAPKDAIIRVLSYLTPYTGMTPSPHVSLDPFTYDFEVPDHDDSLTDDFVACFQTDADCTGGMARIVATGSLPEGVNPDDPRVKEVVARCVRMRDGGGSSPGTTSNRTT